MKQSTPYRVEFDQDTVRLLRSDAAVWSLRWADVELIGYRTTESGPWFDDHFLVFKVRGDDRIYDVSTEWTGASELAEHVDAREGVKLTEKGTLVNSVVEDSVIIWPAERAGQAIQ